MAGEISLVFSGLDADENRLDAYDASISNYGLARVVAILGHYYVSQKIITQAPKSEIKVYIYPPEEGSFKNTVAASVVAGIMGAPFTMFVNRVIESWVPNPNPQMTQVIELLKEQNRLLRLQHGMPEEQSPQELNHQQEVGQFIQQHEEEMLVLRSVTANSFKDIFRPVGRSASHVGIAVEEQQTPVTAIDPAAVALIESEQRDPNNRVLVGVVNSFSRSSKTGIVFSQELGRGIPIQDITDGRLPAGDDYSWSQYSREPIEMHGSYVYWFDGRIKRFLVEETHRPEAR